MLLLLSLAGALAQSQAPGYEVGALHVTRLRAQPTPPGAEVAAVYLWVVNEGSHSDSLLAVTTPIAAKAEIHSSTLHQGVLQMRAVDAVELPPGVPVKIEPGALHIMLRGLKQPLLPGSVFTLTLEFRDAGMLIVQVPVRASE